MPNKTCYHSADGTPRRAPQIDGRGRITVVSTASKPPSQHGGFFKCLGSQWSQWSQVIIVQSSTVSHGHPRVTGPSHWASESIVPCQMVPLDSIYMGYKELDQMGLSNQWGLPPGIIHGWFLDPFPKKKTIHDFRTETPMEFPPMEISPTKDHWKVHRWSNCGDYELHQIRKMGGGCEAPSHIWPLFRSSMDLKVSTLDPVRRFPSVWLLRPAIFGSTQLNHLKWIYPGWEWTLTLRGSPKKMWWYWIPIEIDSPF